MPERPLLILPNPGEPLPRVRRRGGGGAPHFPSRARQAERLEPKFEALQNAMEARRVRLQAESHDLVPEEVVVLETVGAIENFIGAVGRVPGMEWLAEIDETDIPPDDDFFETARGERRSDRVLRGRLFMVFTNQEALREILSLWKTWQSDGGLSRGFGVWKSVFAQLHDVRVWGARDRLHETGVLEDWRERVSRGEEMVPCEIELWRRGTPELRRNARERVAALVAGMAGRIVAEAAVEEIAYHALLVRLPAASIGSLLDGNDDIALVQCEQIQFFRASGQMATTVSDDGQEEDDAVLSDQLAVGAPVVALFDGLPLQAHRRLQNRLIVDDPDDFEENYPATRRRHGTAMASMILHGDLASDEAPLTRPLYVRPILRPDPKDWNNKDEAMDDDTLVVDLLHRAVRRLFEGEGDEPAAAPDVAVINLSIGIRDRPFDQALSPLARLLDWLAWRYRVLFVISAGNHPRRIELAVPTRDLQSLPPDELQRHVIRAVVSDARHRRLLSPAESVNGLTVAAAHHDASTGTPPPRWQDPYVESALPSPINAQGMGFRRGIKPDVLADGGRVVVQSVPELTRDTLAGLEVYRGTRSPGQLVAAPSVAAGELAATRHTRGTSGAAALVSRAAGSLHDVLDELRQDPGGEMIDAVPRAVWLKALVVHGADWGTAHETIDAALCDDHGGKRIKEHVTRLLGYGVVDVDRVRECTASRVTVLGGGALREDQSHVHRIPLPPSLSGWRGHRRLTLSLAWISPVNPRHRNWRRAQLWFSPPKEDLGVERRQADSRVVQRGTVQHEILEGESSSDFVDGASLEVRVSCRADAGALEEEVPYALVSTIEVTSDLWVANIYDEVRAGVQAARLHVVE